MAISHSDWELHVMLETTEEVIAERARETDPARLKALDTAIDFRHFYA